MSAQVLHRVIVPALVGGLLRGVAGRVCRLIGRSPKRPGRKPVPPIGVPLLLTETGTIWVPHPFLAKASAERPLHEGFALGWAPVPEYGVIILHITGGNAQAPSSEMVVATVSPAGLEMLIEDLQSIQRQAGAVYPEAAP